jgi:hypothetical protein
LPHFAVGRPKNIARADATLGIFDQVARAVVGIVGWRLAIEITAKGTCSYTVHHVFQAVGVGVQHVAHVVHQRGAARAPALVVREVAVAVVGDRLFFAVGLQGGRARYPCAGGTGQVPEAQAIGIRLEAPEAVQAHQLVVAKRLDVRAISDVARLLGHVADVS